MIPALLDPPDRPALAFPDGALTYPELAATAGALAREISGLSRVAVWATPTLSTAVGVVAALLAGVPAVPAVAFLAVALCPFAAAPARAALAAGLAPSASRTGSSGPPAVPRPVPDARARPRGLVPLARFSATFGPACPASRP